MTRHRPSPSVLPDAATARPTGASTRTAPLAQVPRAPRLWLTIQRATAATGFPADSSLRRYARAALERDARVTLRLVGSREGRALNAQFRGRDYATNVLTFVYDKDGVLTGDIVLCVPVLRREAKTQQRTLRQHCAHLVIHGMLHLHGHDHEQPRAARVMERKEIALLAAFGVPDPYRDAVSTA